MNRIELWRLRALIRRRAWGCMVVTASPLGGWFGERSRMGVISGAAACFAKMEIKKAQA